MPRQHKSANKTATSGSKTGASTQKQLGAMKKLETAKFGEHGKTSFPVLPVYCPRGVPGSPLTEEKINDCIVFCQDIDSYIKKSHVRNSWESFFEDDTNTFFNYKTYIEAQSIITYHTSSRLRNHLTNAPKTNLYSCQPISSPLGILCKPASIIVWDLFYFLHYEVNIFHNIHEKCVTAIGKYVEEFIDKFARFDQGTYCINLTEWDKFLAYGRRFFSGMQKKTRQEPKVLEKDPFSHCRFIEFVKFFEPLCGLLHFQNACEDVDICALRYVTNSDDEFDDEDYCDIEIDEEDEDEETEAQCSTASSSSVQPVDAKKKNNKKQKKKKAPKQVVETPLAEETTQSTKTSEEDAKASTSVVGNQQNQSVQTAAKKPQGVTISTQAGTPLNVLREQEKQRNTEVANYKKKIEMLEKLVTEKDKKLNSAKVEAEQAEKKLTTELSETLKKLEQQQKNQIKAERNMKKVFEKELTELRKQLEEKDKIIDNNQRREESIKQRFERQVSEMRKQIEEKDRIIVTSQMEMKENQNQHKKATEELKHKMMSNIPSTSTAKPSFGTKKAADYCKSYIEEGKKMKIKSEQKLAEFLNNSIVNSEKKRAKIELEDFQATLSLYVQKAQKNLELLMADKDAESDQLLVHIPEVPRPFSKLTYKKMEAARERKEKEMNPECIICLDDLNDGREIWGCTQCTCKCHYDCFKDCIKATSSICPTCRKAVVDDKEFPALSSTRR